MTYDLRQYVQHYVSQLSGAKAGDAWHSLVEASSDALPLLIDEAWMEARMARVTGIGGVFFKSRNDSAALAAWYQRHLGMPLESFGGSVLRWPDDKAEDNGLTVWHVAEKESQWFSPSDSVFMINYRVDNLDAMLAQLRAGGVEVIGGPESHENGKFAWIMDPEGNKVELWQPMRWDEKNKRA